MCRSKYARAWGLILCVLAAPVHAQTSEETKVAAARQLGQTGVELYMNGDTQGALDKLQRAYALYPAPTLGLWFARALERAGRLVEAGERYRQAASAELGADATQAFRQAKADAHQALDQLTPRLAQLTVDVPGVNLASVKVSLDGNELPTALLGVPIPVDPGAHALKGVFGSQSQEQKLQLKEGETQSATFTFAPEPEKLADGWARSGLNPAQPSTTPAADTMPRAKILKVMQGMQTQMNDCGHGLSGSAVASLIIRGATGQVENAKVKLDDKFVQQLAPNGVVTKDRLVELYTSCMVRVLQQAHFPVFERPLLEIQYPFRISTSNTAVQRVDTERATDAFR